MSEFASKALAQVMFQGKYQRYPCENLIEPFIFIRFG